MALQVNSNEPDINRDLIQALGKDYIAIDFRVHQQFNADPVWTINGQVIHHQGTPEVTLHLAIHIDQRAVVTRDELYDLEQQVSATINAVDGHFTQRTIEPFRQKDEVFRLTYTIKLKSYENFVQKLHKYALTQLDREFTKLLEAKLTED